MVAKRTLREIRRMSAFTNMILDSAKRLGAGNDRHTVFMQILQRSPEHKALPDWRKAYLQGYAEGASAILALDSAGLIPAAASDQAPEPGPAPAPAKARARQQRLMSLPEAAPAPVSDDIDDAKALAWLARMMQRAATEAR
jgi:hypothetical protein